MSEGMNMEPAAPRSNLVGVLGAATLAALPFAAAIAAYSVGGLGLGFLVALLGPALGAASIRWLGSWRAWAWVGLTVAGGAAAWGWIEWMRVNAHCETWTPLVPAITLGASAVVAAAVGGWVTGTSGSAGRALAGGLTAIVLFAALAVASQFALVPLGFPTLIASFSHC